MSSPGEIESAVPPTTPARPARPAPIAKVGREHELHVDARGGEHAAVVDAGADHHADARLGEKAPQADADDDRGEQHEQAIGRELLDHRQHGRAVDPGRRIEGVDLAAEGPQHQVGEDDRQADRHQRLAQVLAFHEAEDEHLHQQAEDGGRQEARRDREQPRAGVLADDPADVGAEQVERAVREVDVPHQAEDEREAAGDEEVERGERQAVEQRLEIERRVVDDRPDREDRDRPCEQQPERDLLA